MIGLLAYIGFYYNIFKKHHFKTSSLLIIIIIHMLFAQFTQLTNTYAGISELLGVLIFMFPNNNLSIKL